MMKVMKLFPFKKVVALVLLMILLTKVMVYVMAMHMTEDRTDQRSLRMQTMEGMAQYILRVEVMSVSKPQ